MQRRFKLLWITGIALSMISGPALAGEPDGNLKAAREAGEKAITLMEQENYAGALEALDDAETHTLAPTLTLLRAQCHAKLGRLVEAQSEYQSIVSLSIKDLKPPAGAQAWEWLPPQKQAQATATKELLELTPRIPLLMVSVFGAEPSTLKVTLDGKALDLGQLDKEVQRDPGRHTITAEAPGRKSATKEVELREGVHEHATLTLEPTLQVAPASRPMPTGAIAAFAVGGAGLVVGAITGGIFFAERSKVSEVCSDTCPKGYVASVEIPGTTSGIGFGVAAVGAVVGTVLFLVPSKKTTAKPVGVAIGPGFVSLKGTF